MDVVIKGQTYLEDGDHIEVAPETYDAENNEALINGEETSQDSSSSSSAAVSSADSDKKEE